MNAPLTFPVPAPADDKWAERTAKIIKRASEDLAADNARAAQTQDARDWEMLKEILGRHSIANVIGIASDLVLDMSTDDNDDYALAAEVLAAAALGCDMSYGKSMTPIASRRRAVADFRDAAAKVRA